MRTAKKWGTVFMTAAMMLSMTVCGNANEAAETSGIVEDFGKAANEMKIVLVLNANLGDHAINDLSYEGLQSAAEKYGFSYNVVDLLESDVPVYMGCETPLIAGLLPFRQARIAKDKEITEDGRVITYHQPYLEELPAAVSKPQEQRAVPWLIDTLLQSEGDITIIAVGPLTNIATAMRADPRIIPKIKQIIIMGGGHLQTNVTSASEFNIHMDPEAAQIVMTSGCDILLVPLDATHRGWVGKEESKKFREIGTKVSIAVADLLDARIEAYDTLQPIIFAPAGTTPPHDALAVCAAIDPTVLTDVQFRRVDVDFSGGFADGMTIVDPRVWTDLPKNVHIALDTDREKFVRMLFQYLA